MTNNILFIYPRKGLYQVTRCSSCAVIYRCDNCDANLITYKKWESNLELLCHQCQTHYSYPVECKNCSQKSISSFAGGIEKLCDELILITKKQPVRLDDKRLKPDFTQINQLFVTTRIFDPGIDYRVFDKIVFVASNNLLSSPDYLVMEETVKNLTELMLSCYQTNLIFDVLDKEEVFFQKISKLKTKSDILNWYYKFIKEESIIRDRFGFPPYKNLILITTQEKSREKAYNNLSSVQKLINHKKSKHFSEITVSSIYPARFLRRKKHYSYHLLIKYPRRYSKYFQLQKLISTEAVRLNMQVRQNPKNLF